jgi:hypothetical protein
VEKMNMKKEYEELFRKILIEEFDNLDDKDKQIISTFLFTTSIKFMATTTLTEKIMDIFGEKNE